MMLDLSNHDAYEVLEFEWAEYNQLDPRGMVACSSGTAALCLALESMRDKNRGTRVMLGDLNMIACPRAVSLAGMEPIFIDCDDTLNMDPELTYQAVWDVDAHNMYGQGYAILATHIYGRRCDMDKLAHCSGDVCTYLIEDLAEAHGVKPHKYTDAACWSHYSNKVVSGEEGGTVWFRNPEHAALARQLRSLGFTDAHDFTHVPRGHNYRMSNVHASLILDSLRRIDLTLENRWLQWHTYNELCPKEWRMRRPDAPWVYAMRIPNIQQIEQDRIIIELREYGARHCFKPCSYQEEYVSYKRVLNHPIHTARVASREVIYLPLSSYSTRCHLDAFDVIQRILDK